MSMYEFRDISSGATPAATTPAESVSVNGISFDSLPGVQTLYTKGRESMSAEVETKALPGNGSLLMNRRYPERIITVGFQLTSSSPEQFRERWNKISKFLNFSDAQIIFADEPDKYYIGTSGEIEQPEPGKLNCKAEFQIVCNDPFKYALEETVVDATISNSNDVVFMDYYGGDIPVKPTFEVDFSDICGHVAFADNSGNLLYFGNSNDASGSSASEVLNDDRTEIINRPAVTENYLYGIQYDDYKGLGYYSPYNAKGSGGVTVAQYAKAMDYGDDQYTYDNGVPEGIVIGGPAKKFYEGIWYSHCMADFTLRTIFDTSGKDIPSTFEFAFSASLNGYYKPFLGFRMKNNETTGKITFEFFKGNQTTENAKFKEVQTDYTRATCYFMNIKIGKIGTDFYFQYSILNKDMQIVKTENVTFASGILSDLTYQFQAAAAGWFINIPNAVAWNTHWGNWPSVGFLNMRITKYNFSSGTITIPPFLAGSKLTVDVGNAAVIVDNAENPGVGVIGNEWDEFKLEPGDNIIPVTFSSWYSGTKTNAKMRYRAVYL